MERLIHGPQTAADGLDHIDRYAVARLLVTLGAAEELYKSFSVAAGDRKYFSGASGIKIADKEHPFPGLRDSKMFAVKHRPFHTVPQVRKRGEDGRKCPAAVMVKQSWHVFKQKIRRPSRFSQPGNFKEQRTSWVGKPSTVSSNRKRLARKSPAQQVEVGHFIGVGFSDVLTEPLSFRIEQRPVALVGIFVDLTMAYADKTSGPAESFPEPANTGEQVNISYGFLYHAPYLV